MNLLLESMQCFLLMIASHLIEASKLRSSIDSGTYSLLQFCWLRHTTPAVIFTDRITHRPLHWNKLKRLYVPDQGMMRILVSSVLKSNKTN
jgi:hypothetical protein